MTPQRQKQRTLGALVNQLEDLTVGQPVLLAYEDVHWIDPTTQELLRLAIERIERPPVLLLVTLRPEFAPWTSLPYASALPLTRLDRHEGAAMVGRLAGAKALPAEVRDQILGKADGVPLFVEELAGPGLLRCHLPPVRGLYRQARDPRGIEPSLG
jgi:predicted ATPase